MKTVAVKTKKRFKLETFAFLFFGLSLTIYLVCSLFVRSINNNLSAKKQSIESEIAALVNDNDAILVSIQKLSSRERVVAIAADAGLELNQENIVTISEGE